jgi:hypothetical protein
MHTKVVTAGEIQALLRRAFGEPQSDDTDFVRKLRALINESDPDLGAGAAAEKLRDKIEDDVAVSLSKLGSVLTAVVDGDRWCREGATLDQLAEAFNLVLVASDLCAQARRQVNQAVVMACELCERAELN